MTRLVWTLPALAVVTLLGAPDLDAQVTAVIAFLKSVEEQAEVEIGLPSQYVPTVLIAIVVLFGLTLIGLRAGNKKVDVR